MMTSQAKSVEKAVAAQNDLSTAKPVRLAWRSTLLDQRAYQAVNLNSKPFKRGFFALLIALGIAAISRFVGIGLDTLTSPQLSVIQDQVYAAITATTYFGNLVAQTPEFAEQFDASYFRIWDLVRLVGGYPSYAGFGSSLIFLLFILISWLGYTVLANIVGYWFGSKINLSHALGLFALAYTPVMWTVVEVIPGAHVPWTLIFLLMLVGKFIAAREAYELGPGASLAVISLPYLIGIILLFSLLIFGAAIGINQIPYVDEILRTLRFAGWF